MFAGVGTGRLPDIGALIGIMPIAAGEHRQAGSCEQVAKFRHGSLLASLHHEAGIAGDTHRHRRLFVGRPGACSSRRSRSVGVGVAVGRQMQRGRMLFTGRTMYGVTTMTSSSSDLWKRFERNRAPRTGMSPKSGQPPLPLCAASAAAGRRWRSSGRCRVPPCSPPGGRSAAGPTTVEFPAVSWMPSALSSSLTSGLTCMLIRPSLIHRRQETQQDAVVLEVDRHGAVLSG